MRPEIEPLQNAYRQWRDELNPERRAAELAEAMKPYAKGQMWAHAPRSARQETQESVLALQRQRAADKMVAVLQAIDEVEPTIRGHVNVAMQPPDPIQSFMARYGRDGLTSGELLQLSTLHELRLSRFDRTLRNQPAPAVLAEYERALSAGEHDLVAFVEQHGSTLAGGSDDVEHLTAAHTLSRRIGEARLARVPGDLVEAQQLIAAAKASVEQSARLAERPELPAAVVGA